MAGTQPESTTEAVKEIVKEGLLGTEEPTSLSASHRASFYKNAKKDEDTEELFMGPDEFIEAIAPPDEDYVSIPYPCLASVYHVRTVLLLIHIVYHRRKSNGNSMVSFSMSPTAHGLARSRLATGRPSKTS